ncbi:spore protein [Metabacillus fastidiosus]|uniref:Spore protein n=1 Tax=Metabacillus fastidiosus TaxID=1458 RepID=A0ABU6NUH0_9BACI|nr:spore protein [Metabacillus fastidiosus]MED4400666.1 spore protein [Metabacillus fastidiosus]MED4453759.1 spore protein [Metabacillus fastidiosus]MED4462837.1 spore protein [Metabacillus fastidiosus]
MTKKQEKNNQKAGKQERNNTPIGDKKLDGPNRPST